MVLSLNGNATGKFLKCPNAMDMYIGMLQSCITEVGMLVCIPESSVVSLHRDKSIGSLGALFARSKNYVLIDCFFCVVTDCAAYSSQNRIHTPTMIIGLS
jgi:hypothetical protein